MERLPPPGIASRAFTHRFIRTWWSCVESPWTGQRSVGRSVADVDGFRECLPDDVLDLPDEVPDLHLGVIARGAAGEAEDLLHDARAPLRGGPDDVEDPLRIRARAEGRKALPLP